MECICHTVFFPPSVGGMQYSNFLLVQSMQNQGIKITLNVYADRPLSPLIGINFTRLEYFPKIRPTSILGSIVCAVNILVQSYRSPNSIVLLLDDAVVRSLGFLPFKVRGRFVSINSGSILTRGDTHLRGRINYFFARRAYRYMALIMVSSSTFEALSMKRFIEANRLRCHGRPVPDYFFSYSPKFDKELYGFNNRLPILFSTARAVHEKGIHIVISALAILKNEYGRELVNFAFVGEGPELSRWMLLAEELKIENIKFLGKKKFEEMPEYFSAADACIFPSFYKGETFGRTWIEAFAFGKPVISTLTENLRYLVSDGHNGFVMDPTPKSASIAIKKLLKLNTAEYAKMSAYCVKTALQYKQEALVSAIIRDIADAFMMTRN